MPEHPRPRRFAFIDTRKYETVTDADAFERWAQKLEAAPLACWDTETSSIDPFAAHLVGLASASRRAKALTFRSGTAIRASRAARRGGGARAPQEWLEDPKKLKVGQNGKYDRQCSPIAASSCRASCTTRCSQSYVLESHQRHDMDSLAQRHPRREDALLRGSRGRGASQIPFDQVDFERATEYSAEDADVTLQLHGALFPRIEKDAKLKSIYSEIEIPVAHVLFVMERNGVLIDMQQLSAQGQSSARRCSSWRSRRTSSVAARSTWARPSSSATCSSSASS
jgi:DNA polymerase-1